MKYMYHNDRLLSQLEIKPETSDTTVQCSTDPLEPVTSATTVQCSIRMDSNPGPLTQQSSVYRWTLTQDLWHNSLVFYRGPLTQQSSVYWWTLTQDLRHNSPVVYRSTLTRDLWHNSPVFYRWTIQDLWHNSLVFYRSITRLLWQKSCVQSSAKAKLSHCILRPKQVIKEWRGRGPDYWWVRLIVSRASIAPHAL
jgi:hypothetical protein